MRPPYVVIVPSAIALSLLAPATAAESSSARFLVSLRATITKQWTYATADRTGGCLTEVSGSGTRAIVLRSTDVSVVAARSVGRRGRVGFTGSVGPLRASISQRGTKSTRTSGGSGCDETSSRASCDPLTRTFGVGHAQPVGAGAGKLSFKPMRGLVPRAFFNRCPGEPAAVRAVTAGLALADARFTGRDLFDRSVGGLTLQGSADLTTTLLDGSARIVHHVRWTLMLRRLG